MKEKADEKIKFGVSHQKASELSDKSKHSEKLENTADKLEDLVIPVIEERARISKKVIEKGNIYLRKEVHEEQVAVDVPITEEEVEVERVAINEFVEASPTVRYEGDTMIVPVLKEVVVKRLVLVEELRVTKRRKQTTESHPLTLRREEVHVRRDSAKTSTTQGSENQA